MTRRRYSKVIEADAEALLVDSVRAARGLCFKLKFVGLSGAPDRLVLLPGARFFFVELKKDDGVLEASQEALFPRLHARGFTVHILRGPGEVQHFIDTHINPAI